MNPFTVTGRYNIRNYVYQNKKTILFILGITALIILAFMYMIYSEDDYSLTKLKRYYAIPEPRMGNGPFGYGRYAPPENIIAQSLVYS